MMYKILKLLANIAFGLMTVAYFACLGYTLATPAVQEGIEGIRESIEEMVSSAMSSMSSDWGIDLEGIIGSLGGSLTETLSSIWSNELTADDFDDPELGQEYLEWRAVLEDPFAQLFGNTDISYDMIEGVAAGSTSATELLTRLDSTTLASITSAAAAYSTTATLNTPSGLLPSGVRSYMLAANAAASDFAGAVLDLVSAVSSVNSGSSRAAIDLVRAAGDAIEALNEMASNMEAAEKELGA